MFFFKTVDLGTIKSSDKPLLLIKRSSVTNSNMDAWFDL